MGRENDDEPVAPRERFADFIVPLIGSNDVGCAVPDRDTMIP